MRKIFIIIFVLIAGFANAQTNFEPSQEFAVGAAIQKKDWPVWNNRAKAYAGTIYLAYSNYFKPKTFWKVSLFGRFENHVGSYSKFNGFYDIFPAFGLYRYCHLFKQDWLQFNYGVEFSPMFSQRKYVTLYEHYRRNIYYIGLTGGMGLDFRLNANFAIGLHFTGGLIFQKVDELTKIDTPIQVGEYRSTKWNVGGLFTNPLIISLKFKIK